MPPPPIEKVEDYSFTPDDLDPGARLPGISAFMRIKNGADFLEATIRSHIDHVDEIVAVYNQCTDATPEILARLQNEFGPERLRVLHYLPRVYPPGSEGHATEPADSPASFVNMSNFALVQTRRRIVMKLDDDHLAMGERLAGLVKQIGDGGHRLDRVVCFSGLNLAQDDTGKCGVLAIEPFSGNGDIGFFMVTPRTRFIHNRRFEDFDHDGRPRVFGDFAYWHLKYLKAGFGFGNREVGQGNPRFARKQARFLADRRVLTLPELAESAPRRGMLPRRLMRQKARLIGDRWQRLRQASPSQVEMAEVCARVAAPEALGAEFKP